MIRSLRKKFVATNMVLVSLVLLVVFGCLLFSTAQSAKEETTAALRMAVEQKSGGPRPAIAVQDKTKTEEPFAMRGENHLARTAVFWVLTDEDGNILESDTTAVDIDDATLAAVAKAALLTSANANNSESGTLQNPDLRFLIQHTPEGLRIAFADRSTEQATLQRLALQSLCVGLGALAAFFAISVFLARLALKPVETAWAQQRQFVADASHELKTPLTVILANAGIMASHPEATVAGEQKWLDGIRDEANRMKQLVEDLLFLARADALRAPAVAVPVDFSSAVESAALAFESVAFERGVSLDTQVAPGLNVLGDGKQLAQLVQILLDNACKYAGAHGEVWVRLAHTQGSAVLRVTNTGPTLAPEELAHLFERFYRTDAARTRGGYGLGLAIAQSIAQTHHGQIKAESKDGKTTFTVTLPVEK